MEATLVKTNELTEFMEKAPVANELTELLKKAPATLEANTLSNSKAIKAGQELIDQAKLQGMSPQLDLLMAEFINKGKITLKNMNDKRAPFTQMMTMVAKSFTGLENGVKEIVDEAQKIRDEFAAKVMKERQEAERQAALKLAKDNEKIEIEKNYRIAYSEKYTDYLLNFKTSKMNWFNDLTLESIQSAESTIKSMISGFSDNSFMFSIPMTQTRYHSIDEVKEIIGDIAKGLVYSSMNDFESNIKSFQRELIDIIPTKQNQLQEAEDERKRQELEKAEADRKRKEAEVERIRIEEQAKAAEAEKVGKIKTAHERLVFARTGYRAESLIDIDNISLDSAEAYYNMLKNEYSLIPSVFSFAYSLEKDEFERLERIRLDAERKRKEAEAAEAERKRKEAEEEKMKLEALKKQQDAQAEASVIAAGQTASAYVDTQATLFDEAPKVKEGYSIQVLNPAAYLLIIQFWFEKAGRNLPTTKIENTSIAQMKAFCEKQAVKTEELIVSPLLKYEPVYKAK